MKKHYTLLMLIFCTTIVFAQTPQKMSYQAVIRNASNVIVANTSVAMRITILQYFSIPVYQETHSVTTNANGLATLEIGNGSIQFGNFMTINWVDGTYFIKTETDPTGGTNYTITATSQLLSVPYALLAEKVVKPTYPAFRSVVNNNETISTIRNLWVDCPFTTLTVPETGKYLVSFFGGIENTNLYESQFTSDLDIESEVRVFNTTTGQTLNYTLAGRLLYFIQTPTNIVHYMKGMRPSTTQDFDLTAGDQLIIQYKQNANNSAITSPWTMVPSGMHILKVAE